MLPFGSRKRGAKLHPHNECGICGESKPVKARERGQSRLIEAARYSDEMAEEMIERDLRRSGDIKDEDWSAIAERIRKTDPEGKGTFRTLRIMEAMKKMTESKLKRKRS